MNIELKNIKVAEHLSQETTAYTADLYINYIKAAHCRNDGCGGPDLYQPYKPEYHVLISAAEDYCKTLPPVPIALGDGITTLPNDLEMFVGELLHKFLCNKDAQKFARQLQRDMKKSILVGTEEKYTCYNFRKPLEEMLKFHVRPVQWLNEQLVSISRKVKPGERILNTNFPEGVVIPEVVNA